jgi:hypothetical protein
MGSLTYATLAFSRFSRVGYTRAMSVSKGPRAWTSKGTIGHCHREGVGNYVAGRLETQRPRAPRDPDPECPETQIKPRPKPTAPHNYRIDDNTHTHDWIHSPQELDHPLTSSELNSNALATARTALAACKQPSTEDTGARG